AVSLAELYSVSERWDEIVELTDGVTNADNASALLCVFRGQAFRAQGYPDAAHESFKEALRARSRDVGIRHLALMERAANYAAQGKKSMARKDLEKILATEAEYPGVRQAIRDLTSESQTV
ncbi:MAG: tetratricopeptide repeat protein, partial [Solirubrobacterales bacterium]